MKPELQYLHTNIPELSAGYLQNEEFFVETQSSRSNSEIVDDAILTVRLAQLIGIEISSGFDYEDLTYDGRTDNIVFYSPVCSALFDERVNFFRSWKQFGSCIKGFNALGLMAEQVRIVSSDISSRGLSYVNALKRKFISSRLIDGKAVFSDAEVQGISESDLTKIPMLVLATWAAFAEKTIVCSTSSNMGIALHEALRYLQSTELIVAGRKLTLLNDDEGRLIIWCPDENADFMSAEKTAHLRQLESEQPRLTSLRTYINRTQRDPGALKDALTLGGYFFPTNPQSTDEIQNLLFQAMTAIKKERGADLEELLKDGNVRSTLASLKCQIQGQQVLITEGVESGISGLMAPYLLMLEQLLPLQGLKAISTWNQASIGAALAAIVKLDMILREPKTLNETTRSDLCSLFPAISEFLDHRKLDRDISTRIHGVFDLANIQSLSQLLGVVVERHMSGKGSAYVGLGSSSYSNGNRCFEILKNSISQNGPFTGKKNFHPATHTLNFFSQALIYGEDLRRISVNKEFNALNCDKAKLGFIYDRIRKPEPAGAAALTGYMLTRLDMGTLSIVQIAYTLKLMGFGRNLFLEFSGFDPNASGLKKFLQESSEEGHYMSMLARNILNMLEWPLMDLKEKVDEEQLRSQLTYRISPIEELNFAERSPLVNIYITGDNTSQPSKDFLSNLSASQFARATQLEMFIRKHSKLNFEANAATVPIGPKTRMLMSLHRVLLLFEKWVSRVLEQSKTKMITKMTENSAFDD